MGLTCELVQFFAWYEQLKLKNFNCLTGCAVHLSCMFMSYTLGFVFPFNIFCWRNGDEPHWCFCSRRNKLGSTTGRGLVEFIILALGNTIWQISEQSLMSLFITIETTLCQLNIYEKFQNVLHDKMWSLPSWMHRRNSAEHNHAAQAVNLNYL